MNRGLLVVIVTFFLAGGELYADSAPGLLVIHPENGRYLMAKGDSNKKAILLSGSHTWAEFQTYEKEKFDYIDWLDKLVGWNHNFMRGWMWEDGYYSPAPYASSGDKYDLRKYNNVYFERLKRRIREAGKRNLYLSVMLFEGWSVMGQGRGRKPVPWPRHPYNEKNNINNINGDPDRDGNGYEVHTLKVREITRLQEAYVKHFIDQLNGFDNIIWEIGNECHEGSARWQYHIVDIIKKYEAAKPKQHLVWVNLSEKDIYETACHADIVSPAGERKYSYNPPAADGAKVVIADSDHLSPLRVTHVQMWKWFSRGMHPILMDCKYQPLTWWKGGNFRPEHPKWQQMRDALSVIQTYADKCNLVKMVPQEAKALLPSSTGYCLYEPGKEYMVYQPAPNESFTVQLPAGEYHCEWIIPTSGKSKTGRIKSSGGKKNFKPPFPWPAALYLKRISTDAERK